MNFTFRLEIPIQFFILLLLLAVPALPVQATDLQTLSVLKRHYDSGRLPSNIKNQLNRDGTAEVLVILNDDDVQIEVARLRRVQRADRDTPQILRIQDRMLQDRKLHILSRFKAGEHEEIKKYEHFGVLFLKVNDTALARLLDDQDVRSIHENHRHSMFLTESLPFIGQPAVQAAGHIGSGTSVAVLDTGIDYKRSAFGNCSSVGVPSTCKVVYAADIAQPDDGFLDSYGHGTNVAGIVAGVAPGANLISLDVFRPDGFAYDSDLLTAFNWVIDNKVQYNIVAMNLSLGHDQSNVICDNDPLASSLAGALSLVRSAGVLPVIASGNDAFSSAIAIPACVSAAVSVGAVYDGNVGGNRIWTTPNPDCVDLTTSADKVACFSNISDFLSILAPGVAITAADLIYSGTSQAAPHVAGAIAVIAAAESSLSTDEIVDRLKNTGKSLSFTRGTVSYQKPRLNLYAALQPNITVTPVNFDFGPTPVGSVSVIQPFMVSNNGFGNLVIGQLSVGGLDASSFSIQNDACSNQILPPNALCTVGARHQAITSGSWNATLNIPSNDPDPALLQVILSATSSEFYLPARLFHSHQFTYFDSLSATYLHSVSGDSLQLFAGDVTANITFGLQNVVVISGGYDSTYTTQASSTIIVGTMVISAGKVTAQNLKIRPTP